LAGASEPSHLAEAQSYPHPFRKVVIVPDAQAACVGAHRGRDGGVIVIGTGTIAWAELKGRHYRAGGWGLPISDEGSGAWLGVDGCRGWPWAHAGRFAWPGLLRALFERFDCTPPAFVTWPSRASPRDFGSLAPAIIEHGAREDPAAVELIRLAAGH